MLVALAIAAIAAVALAAVALRVNRVRRLRETVSLRDHAVSVARRRRDDTALRLEMALRGAPTRESTAAVSVARSADGAEADVITQLLARADLVHDAASGRLASEVRRATAECSRAARSLDAARAELDAMRFRWKR